MISTVYRSIVEFYAYDAEKEIGRYLFLVATSTFMEFSDYICIEDSLFRNDLDLYRRIPMERYLYIDNSEYTFYAKKLCVLLILSAGSLNKFVTRD